MVSRFPVRRVRDNVKTMSITSADTSWRTDSNIY